MFASIEKAALLFLVVLSSQACSKSSGATVSIPAVEPIVKAALPAGLQPGSAALFESRFEDGLKPNYSPTSTTTTGAQYITALFNNYYVNGSTVGGPQYTQGYVLNQVAIVDGRTSLFNGQSTSSFKCLSGTANPFTLDFSALNPNDTTPTNMLKFTLGQVQCLAPFSSPSSPASGEVFGVNGSNASVWVTLTDMAGDSLQNGGAFMNFANVSNAGSTSTATPESVDGLSVNYSVPQVSGAAGLITAARYKATPTTNKFELFFASDGSEVGGFTSSGANGSSNYIGAGFRMISDGVNIYADGTLCTDTGGTSCGVSGNWQPFFMCMNATTLALVDPTTTSNCVTLANSFTLSTGGATITSSSFSSFTSPDVFTFTAMTGDATLGDIGGASVPASSLPRLSTLLTALNNNYSIANASSVAASPGN